VLRLLTAANGTFRTSREVCIESVTRSRTDIQYSTKRQHRRLNRHDGFALLFEHVPARAGAERSG
jgi:hypothetical protein